MITRRRHEAALAEQRAEHDSAIEQLRVWYGERVERAWLRYNDALTRRNEALDDLAEHERRINTALDILAAMPPGATTVGIARMREALGAE